MRLYLSAAECQGMRIINEEVFNPLHCPWRSLSTDACSLVSVLSVCMYSYIVNVNMGLGGFFFTISTKMRVGTTTKCPPGFCFFFLSFLLTIDYVNQTKPWL
ncbi:hypothetical protein F4703DRAFT_1835120 [Phycomyces blakesleeanus]